MAKQTIVKLRDDLDGSEASGTVVFGFDGVAYEIDLSKKNARELEAAMAPYVAVARRVSRSARKPAGRSAGVVSKLNLEEVRAWAASNGHQVAGRGRIAASVLDAFHAAKDAVQAPVEPAAVEVTAAPAKKAPARKAPAKRVAKKVAAS
jgi:hypothetical protein